MSPTANLTGERAPLDEVVAHGGTLSQRILGLDWAAEMPWQIEGGATVELGTAESALPFLLENRAALFDGHDRGTRFLLDPMTPAKARWTREMDYFLIRLAGKTVGLLVGHPTDWTTYYLRSASILPEAQGLGLQRQVLPLLFPRLAQAGVERAEADTSPTNAACVRGLMALGFTVTSIVNSERWGACLQLTKFLSTEAEDVFVRQFCAFAPASRQKHSSPHSLERSTP